MNVYVLRTGYYQNIEGVFFKKKDALVLQKKLKKKSRVIVYMPPRTIPISKIKVK